MTRKIIQIEEDHCIEGEWVKGYTEKINDTYLQIRTLSGVRWDSMVARCKIGGYVQTVRDSYLGCVNEFDNFQEFVKWSRHEVGYDCREMVGKKSFAFPLDKDLKSGSIYSTNTCLYIPQRVNSFIRGRSTTRKNISPMGTYMDKDSGRFRAQIVFNGKTEDLGRFENFMDAHRAWQATKIKNGRVLANDYRDCHPKLYDSLNLWIDKIAEDYSQGVESFKGGRE